MALSLIARRRIQQFRRNRRAWFALWLFLAMFLFSLFAELVANDKPLAVNYDGNWYFPAVKSYPETTFGGEFETEADYRDPVVAKLINDKGWMIWPLIHYSYQTINYNLTVPAPSPPTAQNWLGTDDQGRDVMARLIYGFRISILFGLALTIFGSIIGVAVGAVAGYTGGTFDLLSQRFMEVWSGMPMLYLLIIMSSVITPGFFPLLGLMLLFSWMTLVDVVRAEFLKARNLDYIRAARALGLSTPAIIFKHALPNAMVATISMMPFVVTGSVTTLTSLDFLGFGMPPGSPSLGELLSQGKNNLQAPWLGITAFLSLAVTLSLFTFIGEGVRDAFDPRKIFRE
jgi:microcin C transport system permease protein